MLKKVARVLLNSCLTVADYVLFQNNPILQVMYLVLMCGGYSAFAFTCWPNIPNLGLNGYHKGLSSAIIIGGLGLFHKLSASNPGIIGTPEEAELLCELQNLGRKEGFESAEVKRCFACKLDPRPPRSKHCNYCGKCIAEFDHHCFWVGNCVGLSNHGQFIGFVLYHLIMSIYGGIGLTLFLQGEGSRVGLWNAKLVHRVTNKEMPHTWSVYARWFIHEYTTAVCLWGICWTFSVLLTPLLAWQLHLWFTRGITQYEFFKLKHDDKGVQWKKLSWKSSCLKLANPRQWIAMEIDRLDEKKST